MEIIATGSIVRVVVNGKQALLADLATVAEERNAHAGVTLTSGRIAFQADRGEVWYRKIEVKELKFKRVKPIGRGLKSLPPSCGFDTPAYSASRFRS